MEISKTLRIDRIEESITIAIDDSGKTYKIANPNFGENDIIKAFFDSDGNIISTTVLSELTEQKTSSLKSRLKKLFTTKR